MFVLNFFFDRKESYKRCQLNMLFLVFLSLLIFYTVPKHQEKKLFLECLYALHLFLTGRKVIRGVNLTCCFKCSSPSLFCIVPKHHKKLFCLNLSPEPFFDPKEKFIRGVNLTCYFLVFLYFEL